MDDLESELRRRWTAMFCALAGGDDVPPSERLRAEGMMESIVLLGRATQEEIVEAMDSCYREAFGQTIAGAFGADWQAFFPFPQIPAMGRRAPVYPSTPD